MPQKFVNLENLTSFWGNAKEYIANERQEIEDQLYNWQKTEKALLVQCKPVSNSELHPIVEFKFKETLPEGEKSPSNPSIIEGVNKITVDRQSKNLLIYSRKEGSQANLASVGSDGTITLNGTFTGENASTCNIIFLLPWSSNDKINFNVPLGKYFLSCNNPTTSNVRVSLRTKEGVGNSWANVIGNDGRLDTINKTRLITVNSETTYWYRVIVSIYDGTYNNYTFKLQLEQGDTATTYDINDNNRYIVNLNDTYYGGSIDLSTGLMTVTHYGIIFDSITANAFGYSFNTNSSNENYDRRIAVQLNGSVLGFPQCVSNGYGYTESSITHFNFDGQLSSNFTYRIQGLPANWLVIKDDSGVLFNDSRTVAENKQYFLNWCDAQKLAGTPVTLTYKLENPFTVQLTPTQIRSLPALDKYEPRINTVYTDQEAVQVGYQKYADDPAPLWFVKDMLRANVEAMTSGRNTVVRDKRGNPHIMVVVPKFRLSDIDSNWAATVHPAFIVDGVEKSEILIGKYLASQDASGKVQTLPHQAPWTQVNFDSAFAACRELGPNFCLNTNAMWAARVLWDYKRLGGSHVYLGNTNYGRDSTYHELTGTLKSGTYLPGDTSLTDAVTLTGTGGPFWNDDGTESGIADLVGNVWEWVGGFRLNNGEIQIIPDNDACLADCDMTAASTEWMAVMEDGTLVTPGTADTLKFDSAYADTAMWANVGAPTLNTEITNSVNTGYNGVNFKDFAVASGITAPAILKQLAIFSVGNDLQGYLRSRNYGERLAYRGGSWNDGLGAGPFALAMHHPRTYAIRSIGFRAGFVS